MSSPTLIGIVAGEHDRAVASTMLRCALERGEPYAHVGVIGDHEVFDGVEYRRGADAAADLERIDEHLANARAAGLSHLVLGLPSRAPGAPDLPELDVLCSIGAGGAGTVRTAERGLSFSSRGPLADVGSSEERAGYGYVQFVAHTPSWEGGVAVPLPGVFNVTPALAAITVLELLGVRGREVQEGLCMAATQGHGELLFPPEQHVCAVVEQSRDPRDRRQIVEAARQEFEGFSTEVVTELAGIEPAVARGYARARSTLLVLLGRPGEAYADAFQAAVRRHFAWSTPPRG